MSFINTVGERFSRSWEITTATFHVMWQDKEILLFPILGSIFSIILILLFVFPVFLGGILTSENGETGLLIYGGIFLLYFVVTFVAVFFNAGIVHIAKTRFSGGDATFTDGVRAGFHHFGAILKWALLSATVGLILNILESQADRQKGFGAVISHLVIRLVGVAWAIVSIFVVPAIVLKNQGPVDALKSSVMAVKKTWGESLIRHFGLGIVQGGVTLLGFLLFGAPALFILFFNGLVFSTSVVIFAVLFVLWVVVASLVFSSANTIFNTALFIYADTGKVPKAFSPEVVKGAFRKK